MRLFSILWIAISAFPALAVEPFYLSGNGLESLVFEGPELHASLRTGGIDENAIRHVPISVLRDNPQVSNDPEFIAAIARAGSQGKLTGAGIRSALYSLYLGEKELGFYGLEAATVAEADRREAELREIWAHNISLDRARVHRGGRILLVVWTDGLDRNTWETVNAAVGERLTTP